MYRKSYSTVRGLTLYLESELETARSEGQSSSIRREMQTLSEPITVPIAEKLSSNALVQGKHSQERTHDAK